MILHIFTEEPSLQKVFDVILPNIIPENVSFKIYSHQGKNDLMHGLRTTLPALSKIHDSRVLITRDQDNHDCTELKQEIMSIVEPACACPYKIRIICRELEAWFLGDMNAVKAAYPRFKVDQYQSKARFRNVDNIATPSKLLKKLIPELKSIDYLPKITTAENIAPFLNVHANKSTSFMNTLSGIAVLVGISPHF